MPKYAVSVKADRKDIRDRRGLDSWKRWKSRNKIVTVRTADPIDAGEMGLTKVLKGGGPYTSWVYQVNEALVVDVKNSKVVAKLDTESGIEVFSNKDRRTRQRWELVD